MAQSKQFKQIQLLVGMIFNCELMMFDYFINRILYTEAD